METTTVFQIASAAFAVVNFTARLLSKSGQEYRSADGQILEVFELSQIYKDFGTFTIQITQLPESLETELSSNKLSKSSLRSLCDGSKLIISEIQEVLKTLQAKSSEKFDHAEKKFVSAVEQVCGSGNVENLRLQLDRLRSEAIMETLVYLWYVCRSRIPYPVVFWSFLSI
jgi:hypothetical protein